MASLDEKIASLEAEIEEYRMESIGVISGEDKVVLRKLMISRNDYLTELMKQKNAKFAGNPLRFNQ
jgi:hypothetical protein